MDTVTIGGARRRVRPAILVIAAAVLLVASLVSLCVERAGGRVPSPVRSAWAAGTTPAISYTVPDELTTQPAGNFPAEGVLLRIYGSDLLTPGFYDETRIYVNGAFYGRVGGGGFLDFDSTAILLSASKPGIAQALANPGTLTIRFETTYANIVNGLIASYDDYVSEEFQIPIVEPGPQPPEAPRILSTVTYPHAPTRAQIRWQDNSSDETGFEIERVITVGDTHAGGAPDGEFVPYARVGPNVTSFTDKRVFPQSTVTYRVRAVAGDLASDPSLPATLVTPRPPACRKPSFDLWSGAVEFDDPAGTDRYRISFVRKGNRVVGDVHVVGGPGGAIGRFIGRTSVASPVLEGSVRFYDDDDDLPTALPGYPAFDVDTKYRLRLELLTQSAIGYLAMDTAEIGPWDDATARQPLGKALRLDAQTLGLLGADDVPPSWALAEICMKGGASAKQVAPGGTVVFSVALENGGPCGIGSGRLALQFAVRGGDIVSVESDRSELISQSGPAALVSLPSLGPSGVKGTQRELVFVTVQATAAAGGTVELDADVFDVVHPAQRPPYLPAAIVVPALRTFAVSVR